MTREEARKAAEVMLAYANGEEVEGMDFDGKYRPAENPSFSWDKIKYRVKPKPTYRPFKNKEECWQEMLKHEPFGWLKRDTYYQNIMAVDCAYIYIETLSANFNYGEAYVEFTFADGTPFGIKEE